MAGSRPHDGYIMEYQSSSPGGGNFGIGYSQGARVYHILVNVFFGWPGLDWAGHDWARHLQLYYFVFCVVRGSISSLKQSNRKSTNIAGTKCRRAA